MDPRSTMSDTAPEASDAGEPSRGFFPAGSPSLWALLVAAIVAVHLLASGDRLRLGLLRGLLIVTALFEALAFLSYELRPQKTVERSGRPYHPGYHGILQDAGFNNLAIALLLALAAIDPIRSRVSIGVIVACYVVHATAHVLRYFGIYFGGGHPIPTRPQAFELRDGLQLAAPIVGLLLFSPWGG